MDLSQKIFSIIIKNKLIKPFDTILVGVSGGADSVALLYILYQLRHRLGIKLHVAHFNHRLRPNSDRDEDFVRKLAMEMNLPFSVSCPKKNFKFDFVSEDLARKWRFQFFAKVVRKFNIQSVALAHTQNDLAETVLMRILRGSGLLGLRGILVENQVGEIKIIRPILAVQRKEIEKYLKSQRIQFQIDETNQQEQYLRNKIRLKLLPFLIKKYNSNLPNVLVDLAVTVGDDYDYILSQTTQFLKKYATIAKSKVTVPLEVFLKQPVAIQRMFLRLAFAHLVNDFFQLSFSHIKEVEDMLLNRPKGSVVHWPQSVHVILNKGLLKLSL